MRRSILMLATSLALVAQQPLHAQTVPVSGSDLMEICDAATTAMEESLGRLGAVVQARISHIGDTWDRVDGTMSEYYEDTSAARASGRVLRNAAFETIGAIDEAHGDAQTRMMQATCEAVTALWERKQNDTETTPGVVTQTTRNVAAQESASFCISAKFWGDDFLADIIGFSLRDVSTELYELAASVTNMEPLNASRAVLEMRDGASRLVTRAADEMRVRALVANAAALVLLEEERSIVDFRYLETVQEVSGEEPVAWLTAQARKCLEEAV